MLTAALLLAGCNDDPAAAWANPAMSGDPERGKTAIRRYGCGACHTIPGIPGAHGIVGPPLSHLAARGYLGGLLTNTPENLILWLVDPPQQDPATAMPNVGLSESDARDIAVYLYTLK